MLIQGFVNSGVVGVFLARIFEQKIAGMAELCWTESASKLRFFTQALRVVRKDILSILFFVFVVSFCSFSVPLIVGGGKGTTLEVLIYEKVRISSDWGGALILSFLQSLILFLFSLVKLKPTLKNVGRTQKMQLLQSRSAVAILILFCLFFCGFLIKGIFLGWSQFLQIPGLWQICVQALPVSFALSLLTGALVFIFLLLTAYGKNDLLQRFLSGYVAPSTALIGFAFLLVPTTHEIFAYLKWISAFVILVFTGLYRMGWNQSLSALQKQLQMARSLGAEEWMIWKEITIPQVSSQAGLLAGIASLWAMGDFALSKMIFEQDLTLGMLAQSLMSSYRIEAALALSGLILAVGFLNFLLMAGLGRVTR